MSSSRMRRVDGALLAVLSDAITQQLKDPRVGFVTVTAVKTSPDLRYARVYVSVLGDEDEREASLAGLRSAQGFLQKRVASELRLKHTPELSFEYDRSIDHGMRITELLDHELEHLPAAEPAQPPESAEPDEPSEPSEPQREGGDET